MAGGTDRRVDGDPDSAVGADVGVERGLDATDLESVVDDTESVGALGEMAGIVGDS